MYTYTYNYVYIYIYKEHYKQATVRKNGTHILRANYPTHSLNPGRVSRNHSDVPP